MIIWNQDKDGAIVYHDEQLTIVPKFYQGVLFGYNLHVWGHEDSLGTFDTLEEAMNEIFTILHHTTSEVYCVSNYSEWEGLDYEMAGK